MLTSMWRMADTKATLRCHDHVSRSAGGTAATSTTPRTHSASTRLDLGPKNDDQLSLTHSALGRAQGRSLVISHSLPILTWMMFTKAQSPIEEHMVRTPLRPSHQQELLYCTQVVCQINYISQPWMRWGMTWNEWIRMWNDMKWGRLSGKCWWCENGETGKTWEKPQKLRHWQPKLWPWRHRDSNSGPQRGQTSGLTGRMPGDFSIFYWEPPLYFVT